MKESETIEIIDDVTWKDFGRIRGLYCGFCE